MATRGQAKQHGDNGPSLENVVTLLQQMANDQAETRQQQSLRDNKHDEEIQTLRDEQSAQAKTIQTLLNQLQATQDQPETETTSVQEPTTSVQPETAGQKTSFTLKNAQPPSKLTPTISLAHFQSWLKAWRAYAALSGIVAFPQAVQLAALRTCLDSDMLTLLETRLHVTDDSAEPIDAILTKVQAWFRSQRNIVRDKVEFQERSQKDGESFRRAVEATLDPWSAENRLVLAQKVAKFGGFLLISRCSF